MATTLIALSVPGVLAELAYRLIDHGIVLGELRTPVKRVVDTHALLWLAVVCPSILVFGISLLYKLMAWCRMAASGDTSARNYARNTIYVAARLLLTMIGLVVGNVLPVLVVIALTGSLRRIVWSAVIGFTLVALAAEHSFNARQKSWCRPLFLGAVGGAVVLLMRMIFVDWKIDLTV